jgi:hypothetical protein
MCDGSIDSLSKRLNPNARARRRGDDRGRASLSWVALAPLIINVVKTIEPLGAHFVLFCEANFSHR